MRLIVAFAFKATATAVLTNGLAFVAFLLAFATSQATSLGAVRKVPAPVSRCCKDVWTVILAFCVASANWKQLDLARSASADPLVVPDSAYHPDA